MLFVYASLFLPSSATTMQMRKRIRTIAMAIYSPRRYSCSQADSTSVSSCWASSTICFAASKGIRCPVTSSLWELTAIGVQVISVHRSEPSVMPRRLSLLSTLRMNEMLGEAEGVVKHDSLRYKQAIDRSSLHQNPGYCNPASF